MNRGGLDVRSQILEDLNIRWEHMPSGIDGLSIIIRERELTPIRNKKFFHTWLVKLGVDEVEIEHDAQSHLIVGENMKTTSGV